MKNLAISLTISFAIAACASEPAVMAWDDNVTDWVIDSKSDSTHSVSVWGNDRSTVRFRAEGSIQIKLQQTSAFQRPKVRLILNYGDSQFRSSARESPSILFTPGTLAGGLQEYELIVENANSDSMDGELTISTDSNSSFCNNESRHVSETPFQYIAVCEKVLATTFDDTANTPVTQARVCLGRGYATLHRGYTYSLFGLIERDLGGFEGKTQAVVQVDAAQGSSGKNYGFESDEGIQINTETGTEDRFSDVAMNKYQVDYDRISQNLIYRFQEKEQGAFTEWELEASTLLGCKDL